MNLALIIKFLAKENGINNIDFMKDVLLVDEGKGAYISEWNLGFPKPTEEVLIAAEPLALAVKESLAYIGERASAYPSIGEQLDMMYWDKLNNTSLWSDMIADVKLQFPKG